jgi:glucose-6-phosphate dehydrogenase assembly protein OpcA
MEGAMSSAIIFPAQPEQILKGLGKLWTSLGEEEKQHGKPTVLRACAMTLIVATDEADAGFAASQTISELMHEHPARGIVLAVSKDAENDLQARVLAQCWKPFGKAQQICCEQIEITAKPGIWQNAAPTLAGLTAADLPVIFWCRHKGALNKNASAADKAGLDAIARLATKLIVDTEGMEGADGIDLLTKWQAEGKLIADLEWTRLTPWREPLAHLFDDPARQNGFAGFHTLEIEYTEANPRMQALYLAGWLSAPHNAKVTFRQVSGSGKGVQRVSFRSDTEDIEFERTSSACVTLWSTNGRERKYSFSDASITALMTEELAVAGFDPAFNTALERARELVK